MDAFQGNGTLVFVGVATEDAIAVVDRYPGADERVIAEDVVFSGGGPAATAAVTAARLGVSAALVAVVGDDADGSRIIADLESEGVDVSGIQRIAGERSARSVVVISGPLKTRAISNRPGPRLYLQDNAVARGLIEAARWVHVDQHGWGAVRSHLDEMSTPPRLSVDAGNPITNYRPAKTALYVPTRSALAERYCDSVLPNDIGSLLLRAVADGAQTAVATSGAEGSFAMTCERELMHAPAPSSPIVSTLGAGDVFHGALLAGLVHAERGVLEGGFSQALAYATVVASLSCRGIDGRSEIPSHDEAMRMLAHMSTSQRKGSVR